jgi:hypothetical protein
LIWSVRLVSTVMLPATLAGSAAAVAAEDELEPP